MKLFYADDYAAAKYAFDTTRKPAMVARSLQERPIAGADLLAPRSLTEEEISRVHDPAYVRAVRTGEPRELAQTQGFDWDPGLWSAVAAANGGVAAAAAAALTEGRAGSLSTGLHHARRERGAAYGTFNGLALAARSALDAGETVVLFAGLHG